MERWPGLESSRVSLGAEPLQKEAVLKALTLPQPWHLQLSNGASTCLAYLLLGDELCPPPSICVGPITSIPPHKGPQHVASKEVIKSEWSP